MDDAMFIPSLKPRRDGGAVNERTFFLVVGLITAVCAAGCDLGQSSRLRTLSSPRVSRWDGKSIKVDLAIKNTSSKKWLMITSFRSEFDNQISDGVRCVNYFTKSNNEAVLVVVRASPTLPDRSCSLSSLPGCGIPLAHILQPGDEISEEWILNPPDRAANWLTDKPEIPDEQRFDGNYKDIKTVDIRTEYLEYSDWAEVQAVYPMARETNPGEADLGYTIRWEKRRYLNWIVPVAE